MSNAYYLNSSSSTAPKGDRERRSNFALNNSDDSRVLRNTSYEDTVGIRGGQDAFFSWNVRITPSAIITVGLLLVILCSAIFFYGVFVGKSNIPISTPQELERLVPDENRLVTEDDNSQDILPKEELRFMSRLKREQTGSMLAEPEKQAQNSAQSDASGSNKEKKDDSAKKETEQKQEPIQPKQPLFDYVIRAATFNDRESAQKAAARLNGDGLRTRLTHVKTGKKEWHYVQVTQRGSREDLKNMRDILAKHGMKDAMVIKEQPVKIR